MIDLVTADWQLADNPRDAYRFEFLKNLRGLIKGTRAKRLLVLGDLTEAKDNHSATLVNRVVEEFDILAELCEVIILRGNHDGLTPANPFFKFLRRIPGIRWIDKPTQIDDDLFVPYTKDWDHECLESDYRFIFCHQTFAGAEGESGRKLDGIPVSVFAKGCRVIAGDIHVPQRLGPVTYVGAPYTVDFGDDFIPRVLELDGDDVTSITVDCPMKVLITVDKDGRYHNGKRGFAEGDIVKIKVHVAQKDYAKWPEIRQNWRDWGESNDLVVHTVEPVIEQRPKAAKMQKAAKLSDEETLASYCKARGLDKATTAEGEDML